MSYYTINRGCVVVTARYYPEGAYRIYVKESRKHDDAITLYIHDKAKTDRSVIVFIAFNKDICCELVCGKGDSDD
jgi:hypothetical protein